MKCYSYAMYVYHFMYILLCVTLLMDLPTGYSMHKCNSLFILRCEIVKKGCTQNFLIAISQIN